jgi:hypothetical protein
MLKKLNEIDWAGLAGEYDQGEEIPEILTGFVNNDPNVFSRLLPIIFPENGLNKISLQIVPFLIELLQESSINGRENLVFLLEALASYETRFLGMYPSGWIWRDTPLQKMRTPKRGKYVAATNRAVQNGLNVYLDLLNNPDSKMRTVIPALLAHFPKQLRKIEKPLIKQIHTETDPIAKASMVHYLVQLWRGKSLVRETIQTKREQFLLDLVNNHNEAKFVRLVASMAMLWQLFRGKHKDLAFQTVFETILTEFENFKTLETWQHVKFIDSIAHALQDNPTLQVEMLEKLLRHPNSPVQLQAIAKAERFARQWRSMPRFFAPILGDLLLDTNEDVSVAALRGLSQIGTAAQMALEPLTQILNGSVQKNILSAAWLLIDCNHPELAAPVLIKMLNDPQKTIQDQIDITGTMRWLGTFATPALPKLIELLQENLKKENPLGWSENWLSINIALTLGEIGKLAKVAKPKLQKLLLNPLTKQAAKIALAKIQPLTKDSTKKSKFPLWEMTPDAIHVLPTLIKSLQIPHPQIETLERLVILGSNAREAIPLLQKIVESEERWITSPTAPRIVHEDERFRDAASRALKAIENSIASSQSS